VNLFAKIFLGFWLSTAAIIGSWLLASQYFNPYSESADTPPLSPAQRPGGPGPRELRGMPPEAPPRNIFRIYYGLHNVSAADLPAWIARQERQEDIEIFLVDSEGREIFGRALPPGSERLLRKLSGFRRRAAHREANLTLFGQEVYRPEWGALKLVIATHPPASPIIKMITERLWLRLLLALLISGAISYAVSRYLTRPLKQLQHASRALADGNLATRLTVAERGGDETDELARDFNTMAQQLEEKIQAQKRLLNDVSHELRSPLARLRVALALAERDPENSAEQLRRMELETQRLDELIGQLLSVPDRPTDMEDSLDVVGLLEQLCADAGFEWQDEDKHIAFDTRLEEAVVRTHGDLLKRALENVIRNAMQYTHAGTTVLVQLATEPAGYAVTVEDEGPGVPERDLKRVFEPFYRIDEARRRETGGFGLGLSIAQRAIQQHRGTILAQNTGRGLRIRISLPSGD